MLKPVTSTPVIFLINTRIKYETRINIKPAIAEVKVFLAPSKALGSPPEVINLNPPTIKRIKRTIPAKPRA